MSRSRSAQLLVITLLASLGASSAMAQSVPPEPGRVELGFGLLWVGSQSLGSATATETTSTGGQLPLFSTSTALASRTGIEGRLAVRVWRSIAIEAAGSYATPDIRTQISNDFEGAAAVTATERIQQYTVGGGIIWRLPFARTGWHLSPFVTAGAGYLRQLHESGTLAETGQIYQFGGGVSSLLIAHPASRLKGIGLRLDARAAVRSKGVAFADGRAVSPALGASLYARF
jgi:hypothetical protein